MGVVNSATFVETVSQAAHTFALTVSAGTNRKVHVDLLHESTRTITALTFNGVSFLANVIQDKVHTGAANLKAASYYYDIPDALAAGDYNIVATTSAAETVFSAYGRQLASVAAGAPEDSDFAEQPSTELAVTLSLTATEGATICAGHINGSGSSTHVWSGAVTERTESDETGYTTTIADGTAAEGANAVTCTQSGFNGRLLLIAASYAAVVGPTITDQPDAATAVVAGPNATTAVFTVDCAAAITSCPVELEDAPSAGTYATITSGVGGFVIDNAAFASGTCTLTYTASATTHTGKKIRFKPTDSGGTTTSDAVVLTVKAGVVQSATSSVTNGSGVPAAVTWTTDDSRTGTNRTLVTWTADGVTLGTTTFKGTP